jgi:hypothetical protein
MIIFLSIGFVIAMTIPAHNAVAICENKEGAGKVDEVKMVPVGVIEDEIAQSV